MPEDPVIVERLAPLREQARTVVVTGKCECGCPTIHLSVDRSHPAAEDLGSPAVESGSRQTADMDPGSSVGIILFLDHGFLSSLEAWYVSAAPPSHFPATAELESPHITG